MSQSGIIPSGRSHPGQNAYPLVKAVCDVSIVDVNVHAKLSQTYVSTSGIAQDVNYVFPLPSNAAVSAFTAVIDDEHTIKGVVKERQQAQRDFDTAVKAGKTAALLKHHTSQVFEVSLGNIKPGQTIAVHIEFVSIIAHAGTNDSLRVLIPTSVAPFYGTPPATLRDSRGVSYPAPSFELSAAFQMAGNITSITSDTHSVSVSLGSLTAEAASNFNPTRAHVSLRADKLLTNDIVLELKSVGLDRPRCLVQRRVVGNETIGAFSLTLVPRFAATPISSQEYIFLVDRSGSMSGGRIRAVRDALQIMVRSLPSKGTTFNIFSFGDRCDSLWPTSVPYDKESVANAASHIDRLEADYGGTEIASALKKVFDSRKSADSATQKPAAVFVLTDGEAWDLDRVFANVANGVKDVRGTRVFVLGVGNQVSTEMCDGIARAGRGVATYVREAEKPDAKLVGLLKSARGAPVDNVSVDWGVPPEPVDDFDMVESTEAPAASTPAVPFTAPISLFDDTSATIQQPELGPTDIEVQLPPVPRLQQAPARADQLPPLYPGDRFSLFAIISGEASSALPQSIKISGTMNGAPVTLDVAVEAAPTELAPKEQGAVPFIHTLAARALIQDIEDAAKPSPLTALAKAQIARLGTTYSLASSQTSFVAIDERAEQIAAKVADMDAGRDRDRERDHEVLSRRAVRSAATRYMDMHALADEDEDEEEEGVDDMAFVMHDELLAAPALAPPEVEIDAALMAQYSMELAAAASAGLPDDDDDDMALYCAAPAPPPLSAAAFAPPTLQWHSFAGQAASTPEPQRQATELSISSLARAQQFDGSFPATDSFVIADLQLGSVPAPPPQLVGNDVKQAVWNTILALAVIKRRFSTPEERSACEFMEDKAKEWILETIVDELGVAAGDEAEKQFSLWMGLAESHVN